MPQRVWALLAVAMAKLRRACTKRASPIVKGVPVTVCEPVGAELFRLPPHVAVFAAEDGYTMRVGDKEVSFAAEPPLVEAVLAAARETIVGDKFRVYTFPVFHPDGVPLAHLRVSTYPHVQYDPPARLALQRLIRERLA